MPKVAQQRKGNDLRFNHDHARHNELFRALQACRLLAAETLTLQELAERLGCNPRTIRRAIYLLQDAGIDVMAATGTENDGADLGVPIETRVTPAKVYKLDLRAWVGFLYLQADGMSMEGGAR